MVEGRGKLQNVEIFQFEMFESEILEFKAFNILAMFLDDKISDYNVLGRQKPSNRGTRPQSVKSFEFNVFEPQNLGHKAFNIRGPCPWVLKVSICMSLNSKTSKSKLLASWDMAPGC